MVVGGAATYVSLRINRSTYAIDLEHGLSIFPHCFFPFATISEGLHLGATSSGSGLSRGETNIGGARGWSSGSGIHQRVIGFLGVAGWPRADRVCNLPPRHSHRQAEHLTPTLFQSTSLFKSFCGFVEQMCAE